MPFSWLIILILILLFAVYGPLADLLFHVFCIGSVTRGSELSREMALTFDDGPDPLYTPQLLQLLAEHDAKAVFFLVGRKVRLHPDLVREIHAQGHVIGNHTEHHRNGWFLAPWSVRREIASTNQAIEAITGERVAYFRPPWGRFNLWLRLFLRQSELTPVLWTFAGKDWRAGDQTKVIEQILLSKAQSGAIVLLHDSGGAPGAPARTLQALTRTIPRLRTMGFTLSARPVTLAAQAQARRKGSFPRLSQRMIHPLWRRFDQLFDMIYHVFPMTRMFRLSVVNWRFGRRMAPSESVTDPMTTSGHGEAAATAMPATQPDIAQSQALPETLPDTARAAALALGRAKETQADPTPRVLLDDGMPLVELHLQNLALQELVKISSPEKMAIRGLREVRDSLREVALSLAYDARFSQAHGVFGMTMMHRGMDKLGFHVEDIPPTLFNRSVALLLTWIMVLYHPQGRGRLRHGLEEMHPRLMWMTREELFARYLTDEVRQRLPE